MLSDRQLEERKLRQERILSSALEVFKANGLDGATMDSIAEKAGFGKATLYYYFSSKEEVFLGIMEEGWKSLMESLEIIIQEEQSPRKTFIKILVQIAHNAKKSHTNQIYLIIPISAIVLSILICRQNYVWVPFLNRDMKLLNHLAI